MAPRLAMDGPGSSEDENRSEGGSMTHRMDRVTFKGAFGDRLAASLERPEDTPRAHALFAHCFTCSKDLKAARWITEGLVRQGFAVLRFDFTGLGESEGDFADTNFSSNLADLVAAAEFMRDRYEAPRLLVGHSLGGTAVLAAARSIPESRAVATIGSPSDTQHLGDLLRDHAPDLEHTGEAEVRLAGRAVRIRRQLLEDLAEQSMHSVIEDLGRALMIFHSPHDDTVSIDHAARIFAAARHPKSFVSLDGADHLLIRDEGDAHYVAAVLAAWAARYVVVGS
jgi:putative redox protein